MAKSFYYYFGQMRIGPVSGVQLAELARKGGIDQETIIEGDNGIRSRAKNVAGLVFKAPNETTASTDDSISVLSAEAKQPFGQSGTFGERTSVAPEAPGTTRNGYGEMPSSPPPELPEYRSVPGYGDTPAGNAPSNGNSTQNEETVSSKLLNAVSDMFYWEDKIDKKPVVEKPADRVSDNDPYESYEKKCNYTDFKIGNFNGVVKLVMGVIVFICATLGNNLWSDGGGILAGIVTGLFLCWIIYTCGMLPRIVHIELLQEIRDALRQIRDKQ